MSRSTKPGGFYPPPPPGFVGGPQPAAPIHYAPPLDALTGAIGDAAEIVDIYAATDAARTFVDIATTDDAFRSAGTFDVVVASDDFITLSFDPGLTDTLSVGDVFLSAPQTGAFSPVFAPVFFAATFFGLTATASLNDSAATDDALRPTAFGIALPSDTATGSDIYASVLAGTAPNPFSNEFSNEFGSGFIGILDLAIVTDVFAKTAVTVALPFDISVLSETLSYVVNGGNYSTALTDSAVLTATPVQPSFLHTMTDASLGFNETWTSGFLAYYSPFTVDFSADFGTGTVPPGSLRISENESSTDTLTGIGTAVNSLSDLVTGIDIFAWSSAASLSGDNAATGDTLAGVLAPAVGLTDAGAGGDVFTAVAGPAGPALSDTAAGADLYGAVKGYVGVGTDTAAGTDLYGAVFVGNPVNPWSAAFNYQFGSGVSPSLNSGLAEAASTGDTLSGTLFVTTLARTDTATTNDVWSRVAFSTGLTDSITGTDTRSGVGAAAGAPTDSASSGDVYTPVWTFAPALNEAAAGTESLSASFGAATGQLIDIRAVTDTLDPGAGTTTAVTLSPDSATLSDTLTPNLAVVAALSDAAAVDDALAVPGIAAIGLSDLVAATDLWTPATFAAAAAPFDAAAVLDTISGAALVFTQTDVATADDATAYILGYSVSLTDSAATAAAPGAADAVGANDGVPGEAADTADAISAAMAADTALSGDTAATDDRFPQTIFLGAQTDTQASTDAFTGAAAASATFSDTASNTDLVAWTTLSFILTDAGAGADLVDASGGMAAVATLPEAVATAADPVITAFGLLPRSFTDISPTNDVLIKSGINLDTDLSDTLSGDDAVSAAPSAWNAAPHDASLALDQFSLSDFSTLLLDSGTLADAIDTLGMSTEQADDATVTTEMTGSVDTNGDWVDNSVAYDALTPDAFGLSLDETAATTDAFVGAAGADLILLTDIASTADTYAAAKGFPGALADILGDSDTWPDPVFGYAFDTGDTLGSGDLWSNLGLSTLGTVTATAVPTGGAVMLQFSGFFSQPSPVAPAITLTIERAVEGSGNRVLIYQGPPIGVFLDVGDSLPEPLDATTAYVWYVGDGITAVQVGPLVPASSFVNEPDQLTQILIRALQGAIDAMILPPGVQPALVTLKMPQNGWTAMPFIVVNLDLIQQTETEIGEDFPAPNPANLWTLFANAKRVWRITVISQAAEERDFYRDSLLAAFRILKATAFAPLGYDVSHTFSATSYSSTSEWEGLNPGFYGADLMLEVNGIFPAAVLTNYPVILTIASNPTFDPNTFIEQVL